jgi:ATP-dependent Zn protease
LQEKLFALLVQESPYRSETIDQQLNDTIKKILKRAYKEKRNTLTREIAESEKSKDQGLRDSLVAEWNRLLEEEKTFT